MSAPPPNIDLSENKSPQIIVTIWVLLGLTTVAFALRVYTRLYAAKVSLWWDDYLTGCTLFCAYAVGVVAHLGALNGIGRHIWAPGVNPIAVTKLLWAGEITYTIVVFMLKMSVILFYYRLFNSSKRFRIWLYVLGSVSFLWFAAVMVTAGVQCRPFDYFWTQYSDPTAEGVCIDLQAFFIINCSISVGIDLVIMISPIFVISNLQMSRLKRFSLIVIFMLGIFGCAAGIARVVLMKDMYKNHDITWNQTLCFIWSIIEPTVSLISACLLTLGPLKHVRWVRDCFRAIASSLSMMVVSMRTNDSSTLRKNHRQCDNSHPLGPFRNASSYGDPNDDRACLAAGERGDTSADDTDKAILVERCFSLETRDCYGTESRDRHLHL